MKNDVFIKIFTYGASAFCIMASVLNWDFFFNNRKSRIFVTLIGRTGARILYTVMGIGLVCLIQYVYK